MKKRVIIIFLTLLFTILAFGKVNLNAKTTDEGTQLEETTLSESASETEEEKKDEVKKTSKEEIKEETKEKTDEVQVKENEKVEETEEKITEEKTPQVENKTKEEIKEKTEDQQIVSDAKKEAVDPESKEEEIKKDEKTEEKKDEKAEEKTEDTKKDAEAEVKPEEDKKQDETKDAEVKTEEKAKEGTEEKPAEKKEENAEEGKGTETNVKELKAGETLEIEELAENPIALGAGQGQGNGTVVEVKSFDELVSAINNAKDGVETTIVVTESFEITNTITIGEKKIIVLTSKNEKPMDEPWKSIKQPKDYAEYGEEKQRDIIEEARERGEEAIKDAEKNIIKENDEYYYNFDGKDIIIKRSNTFTGTMFEVNGTLTLGNKNSPINFDGNKKEVTLPTGSEGQFFKVNDKAKLTLKNGIIANGKAEAGYSAAVSVEKGGEFTMDGGRISSNYTYSNSTYPTSAGAVYVSIGGKFIMKNGLIDHNKGSAGAITAGDLYGAGDSVNLYETKDKAALVNIEGGKIISNSSTGKILAGGIVIFPAATLNIDDGIIANNTSNDHAGGITISDQFVSNYDNALNGSWVETRGNYDEYVKHFKAEANFDGGLLFKNISKRSGGAVFVDSNHVHFNRTMILNNSATMFGGAVYVSFPPRVQELREMLITENRTKASGFYGKLDTFWGGPNVGGGIWNCPDGYFHIGDRHSVYVFNNNSKKGADYVFSKKTDYFRINKKNVADQFYSFISPVTKDGNIIKYFNDELGYMLPLSMSYTRDLVYLKAIYDENLKAEAWKNSGTFIMGNQAGYGAGIGSDASIQTPDDKGDIDFKFKKHWDESIDKSEYEYKDIHLDIYIVPNYVYDVYTKTSDGYKNNPHKIDELYVRSQYNYNYNIYKYGEVVLNKNNNWEKSFSDYKNNLYPEFPSYIKDNGLPFTPQELASKGLKYMFIERETGYATTIEENYKEEKNGKIEISRELSADYDDIDKLGIPDYYLYYVDEYGHAHYLTKAKKEGEGIKGIFSHPMLNKNITGIEFYGKDRNYVEGAKKYKNWIKYFEEQGDTESADYYRLLRDLKGYKSGDEAYAFFLKKDKDGLKLYVPYLFIQNWDEEGYSGFNYKVLDNSKEKIVKTYEIDVTNRPYTDANIEKTWKMLTEDEIRQALGEHNNKIEVKNRDVPDQVNFFLLKNNKKIIVNYIRDKVGRLFPVYRTITVRKNEDWKANIGLLDPLLLQNGAYSIEEEPIEGFKFSYKIIKGKDDDKPTELRFRVNVPLEYRLIEGYDKNEEDYKYVESLREYFNEYFGDIKINLLINGKVVDTKKMKWTKEVIDLGEYGNRVTYSLDSDNILFGFDGKDISVYTKGKNIRVKYYNSMDNAAGLTNYNIYLEKNKDGAYTLYSPNLLKKGKFYKMLEITEKERNSGYIYPLITEFKASPYEKSTYTFLATNEELPPEPPEPPTPRKTIVRVRKVWQALGETRDIKVELYINGEASGKFLTLNEANDWSASFTNLDIEDDMGNQYIYTVKEVGEKDKIYTIDERRFEVSYSGDMYNGFTILNKEVPPEEPPTPEEPPEEPEEPEPEPPTPPTPPEEHIIPKTGVSEDVLGIFLALMILIGLVYIKKKYILKKSK